MERRWFDDYIDAFIAAPGQNDAADYGVSILPAKLIPGKPYFRVVGVHKLTGEENHGQHNVFGEVIDEQGNRLKNITLVAVNVNGQVNHIRADKPDSEPAASIPMWSQDTLKVYVSGDTPSEQVAGLHTRHADDDPPGSTRGHHSYLVVWQRVAVTEPEKPEQPEEPEEPQQPPDWLTHFDGRQHKQIAFSRLYARDFGHGATGHNDMLIIAKMAELLDGLK